MVNKKKRDEVWKHLKPYMDDNDTVEDLVACCERCEEYSVDHDTKEWCDCWETCPVFKLWLSNEYYEWCDSFRGSETC